MVRLPVRSPIEIQRKGILVARVLIRKPAPTRRAPNKEVFRSPSISHPVVARGPGTEQMEIGINDSSRNRYHFWDGKHRGENI